mmetsp:Transcript_11125/g.23644  ORF Transcript_11125/g.23644 Transcript_11125/m.23644 type:complete len:138 (+) Transcript_11125:351-764(+)
MRPEEKMRLRNKFANDSNYGNDDVSNIEIGGDTRSVKSNISNDNDSIDRSTQVFSDRKGFLKIINGSHRNQRGLELIDGLWIDGLINQEPWQDHNYQDWETAIREVKNFLTGILFLLVVRRVIFHLLRTRYRSHSME